MGARHRSVAWGLVLMAGIGEACGNDPPPPYYPAGAVEQAGQACTSASQCYTAVNPGALEGAAVCLDRVSGGYCTHECSADANCCAAPGECLTTWPQVCSPFESTGQKLCLLSCEKDVLTKAGWNGDADAYCVSYAYTGFSCRSSGGGSENRKVCVP